jgi:hypothetical protein
MGEIWWLDFGKKQNFRQNLNQCQLSFLVPLLCVHGRERGRKIWMSKRTCKVFNLFKTYPLVFLLSHFAWIFLLNWLQIVLTCMCKKERDMRERTCKISNLFKVDIECCCCPTLLQVFHDCS